MALFYFVDCRPAIEKFFDYIELDPQTGCWNWTGSLSRKVYARFHDKGYIEGHVYSYKLFIGDVPADKELHHECRNKRCVNCNHLKPMTHQENCQADFLTTHCKNGHEYLPGSFYKCWSKGRLQRHCKICAKQRSKDWYLANPEKAKATRAAYHLKNRDRILASMAAYKRKRKSLNPDYTLKQVTQS